MDSYLKGTHSRQLDDKSNTKVSRKEINKMKRSISVISIICILFSSILSVQALGSEKITCSDMKRFLIEEGLPENYVEVLPVDRVEIMYGLLQNPNTVYDGTVVSNGFQNNANGVSTYDISSDILYFATTTLTNYTYNSTTKRSKINEIYVFVDFVWDKNRPIIKGQDGISVNWDGSIFAFKSNSFQVNVYARMNTSSDWNTSYSADRPGQVEQGGLGFAVDLTKTNKAVGTTIISAHYIMGNAYFTLVPRASMYTATANQENAKMCAINSKYVHQFNPISLPVSFSINAGGVGISISGLTDEASSTTFYYYSN